MSAQSLMVTEIYSSIQGESSYAGLPCTFIRLTGCPLRCRWCDTVYSFAGGEELGVLDVLTRVKKQANNLVELTGGEPLAQEASIDLMQALIRDGYRVLLETGGSEPVSAVPSGVHIIMDLKCPDSKMSDHNLLENLESLKASDEIKFVVASRVDFDWAEMMIREYHLDERFKVLLSPAFGLVKPKDLVDWLLAARLDARLNLQLHKYIWSPKTKGV